MSSGKKPIKSGGPYKHALSHARIVSVFFHADHYSGRCKLINIDDGKVYESERISKVKTVGVNDKWVAVFPDSNIPPGNHYYLEVPCIKLKKGTTIRHRVKVDYSFSTFNVDETKEKARPVVVGGNNAMPVLCEFLLGDGYSLEEAFIGLFGYEYLDTVSKSLNSYSFYKESIKDQATVSTTNYLATFYGAIKFAHDYTSTSIGWLKLDNEYFRTLSNLRDAYGYCHAIIEPVTSLEKSIEDMNLDELYEGLTGEFLLDKDQWDVAQKQFVEKSKTIAGKYGVKEWQESVDKYTEKPLKLVGAIISCLSLANKFDALMSAESESDKAHKKFLNETSNLFEDRGADNEEAGNKKKEPWFSREELSVLEKLKQADDHAASKKAVEGLRFVEEMVGLGLGFIFPGGFLKNICKPAANALDVIGTVKNGLEQFETSKSKALTDKLSDDFYEWFAYTSAKNHNESSLLQELMSTYNMNLIEYRLAFYFRCKVLYGLMDLIRQCEYFDADWRWTTIDWDEKKVVRKSEDQFRKLKVQEYIDKFILSEQFWVKRGCLLCDWVERFHLDYIGKGRQSDENNVPDDLITWDKTPSGKDWYPINFQKFFPIHFMDHPNAFKFAETFSTDFGMISEDDIEETFWQVAHEIDQSKKQNTNRMKSDDIIVTKWKDLEDGDEVDSETPVRGVIILKEDSGVRSNGVVPVTLQLKRVDGYNKDGPIYKGGIRRITKEDRLNDYIDRKGAIIELSYTYKWKDIAWKQEIIPLRGGRIQILTSHKYGPDERPSEVYKGIKPLDRRSCPVEPMKMKMALEFNLGRGAVTGWLGRAYRGDEVVLTWNCVSWPSKDKEWDKRNQAKFRDPKFLRRQTKSERFKYEVESSDVEAFLMTNYHEKGKDWDKIDDSDNTTSVYAGQPVRLVLVYKKENIRSSLTVPVKAKVMRYVSNLLKPNIEGPLYRVCKISKLDNLGKEFTDKYGWIIDFYYWRADFNEDEGLDTRKILGIKLIDDKTLEEVHRGELDFSDYHFYIKYIVGDSWDGWEETKPIKLNFYDSGPENRQYYSHPYTRFVYDSWGWSAKYRIVVNEEKVVHRPRGPLLQPARYEKIRDKFRRMLRNGEIDDDIFSETH